MEHRDHRGYKMQAKDAHMRRPRTVFFSCHRDTVEFPEGMVDFVWEMPHKAGDAFKMYKFDPADVNVPQQRRSSVSLGTSGSQSLNQLSELSGSPTRRFAQNN